MLIIFFKETVGCYYFEGENLKGYSGKRTIFEAYAVLKTLGFRGKVTGGMMVDDSGVGGGVKEEERGNSNENRVQIP